MWGDCIYDEKSSVEVGNLMGMPTTGTNGVFLLNSQDDVSNDCYFTTKEIEFDALHEVDEPFIELKKLETAMNI